MQRRSPEVEQHFHLCDSYPLYPDSVSECWFEGAMSAWKALSLAMEVFYSLDCSASKNLPHRLLVP